MRIFLTPSDVLFFRSARPFNAGEDNTAQSIFPPTPETIQGMLRALIASNWAATLAEAFDTDEVREVVGDRKSYGRFRLVSVTPGRRRAGGIVERLFPAPAHLQKMSQEELAAGRMGGPFVLLPQRSAQRWGAEAATNLPEEISLLLAEDESVEAEATIEPFDDWLTEDELNICLHTPDRVAEIHGTPAAAIYEMEMRTGIGLHKEGETGKLLTARAASKTTKKGLYYRTAVVRMKPDYGLVVDFELAAAGSQERIVAAEELLRVLRLPAEGWCQLGGERRIMRYRTLTDPSRDAGEGGQQGQRTLLYFVSPACFSQGWRPESWEEMFGAIPVAAAIPRIERIGGWALDPGSARGAAKTMRRCVPAGSVYFFDRPVTVPGPYSEYGREIGYGYTRKGGW
jgi:CRISPR-associated protein Cmr3